MNKLMGFFELKDSGLPSVPWRSFDEGTKLDSELLWTIRTAMYSKEDINLPRIVGKTAEEAYGKAIELYRIYRDAGMIIYYPYFIADKSGTLQVDSDETVIEAVDKDLWNLVTYNNKDITIIRKRDETKFYGNADFLTKDEVQNLYLYADKVRKKFRDYMNSGKTLLLEWSFAYNTDINKQPKGEKYLVFYEIREI